MLQRIIDSIGKYNLIEIELEGELPEEEEKSLIPFHPRKKKLTIWDLEKIFDHASKSENVKGVLLIIRNLKIGLARAWGIRRNICELRESGKRVFVYLETGGNIEYLISSAAEMIFFPPWSTLNLIGLKAEASFLKDTFDRLGIEAQLRGLGQYKSAAETFTRTSMSKPHREMLASILDDFYAQFIESISHGRGIEENSIKELVDRGPFTAEDALREGLVDWIGYHDDFEEKIRESLTIQIRKIGALGLLRLINFKDLIRRVIAKIKGKSQVIAIVSDSGMISHGSSKGTGMAKILGSQTIISHLNNLAKDRDVKAIILRILTPGGSGLASDLICHQLKLIAEKKPIVVSMSDVAASGGYLIGLGANKIVAEPFTLTGSIGIISGKFNLQNLYDKLGVIRESIIRGKSALMFSSSRGFTKTEEENLLKMMKSLYNRFVERVAIERKKDFEKAESLSQGRVWTGRQAKDHGLIDEIGGMKLAIEVAKKEAGIPETISPVVKFISKPKGLQFDPFAKPIAFKQQFETLIELVADLDDESFLALMPFWIKIT
ncbi:MAG: signal peptide peptidase SppA [Thermodesulfobacteriota bacterium]